MTTSPSSQKVSVERAILNEEGKVLCTHGELAVLKTSNTARNPNRKFWACSIYKDQSGHCGFFTNKAFTVDQSPGQPTPSSSQRAAPPQSSPFHFHTPRKRAASPTEPNASHANKRHAPSSQDVPNSPRRSQTDTAMTPRERRRVEIEKAKREQQQEEEARADSQLHATPSSRPASGSSPQPLAGQGQAFTSRRTSQPSASTVLKTPQKSLSPLPADSQEDEFWSDIPPEAANATYNRSMADAQDEVHREKRYRKGTEPNNSTAFNALTQAKNITTPISSQATVVQPASPEEGSGSMASSIKRTLLDSLLLIPEQVQALELEKDVLRQSVEDRDRRISELEQEVAT
ncbi:hypothetical protein FA95DRAFT_1095892 [Auriscalpium vulgare]|uniref:Uncharacterized protein n=1 Tax=Auriscalpium vulgare TaxID=40419 RepID=A0ACB8RWS5_9AGAM|nr:hypothetical protein FA95DRAFT_1095892 [Auriscalpium vulgare]